jgi:signal peptidase I
LTDYRKVLQSNYAKTAVSVGLVVAIALGFFFGLGLALGTSVPLRVVSSGSMCTSEFGCDGWSQPFTPTLHRGDIIVIQAVKPEDLNADYPNSDIIIYQNPDLRGNPEATPIVHRIVAKYQDSNGTWHFQTKGDGNGSHWPQIPTANEYDSHIIWTSGEGVPQDLVYGKVVMRIPTVGLIALFMQENAWALPLVIGLTVLFIALEFYLPVANHRRKRRIVEQQNQTAKQP